MSEMTTPDPGRPTTPAERDRLLGDALGDMSQAYDAASQGEWMRAYTLLKLATDQIEDAGVLP